MGGTQREPGRRERALFDALTQAADEAGIAVSVAVLTGEGARIAYCNEAAAGLTGVGREELMQRPVWSFIAPDELPRLRALHEQRLAGDALPSTFETVLLRPDGTRVPIEIASSRVDLDGEPASVTFIQDISARRRAQSALEGSEARFRTLAEGAPDGIAIMRWPTIVYVNRAAATLLGYESPEQAIGRSMLERLTPVGAETADQRVGERLRGERVGGVAEYGVRGSDRVVEVSATAIEYEGQPAVLGFARDVTERKAIVARLMESEKLAAIGTLAAGVAHEVNNPLAYLLLNLEILIRQLPKLAEDPTLLPALIARLEQARHGGERVKTIVRDLQIFTRRGDGEGGPVLLDAALDAALSIAAHELRHTISIVRRFELVPAVLGNATRYEQLFLNLLLNAAHAVSGLPPERRVIELELRPEGEKVLVVVRDRGTGMCDDTLGRALEPFFTTKPLGVGTGLGLSICQNIVHAAGGKLQLQSELGVGTTVTVQLPAYRSTGKAQRTPPPPPISEAPLRRASLLVVDDERAITHSIAYALEDEHEVVTCSSADQALDVLRARPRDFDVVLCDLVMPDRDGPSLFAQVTAELPEIAPRFVFMTGGASLPHAQRFLSEVANPRLDKPFELGALRDLLRRLL